ncbi:MAG TPA: DEAD/DEAH box helicase [Polyangiales bacterium]
MSGARKTGAAQTRARQRGDHALSAFHPATQRWFEETFAGPTPAQAKAWPSIVDGHSTLLVAPTGSGKTLSAFLCAIDRLLFTPAPDKAARCRLVYVSPLKALAFDIEKNLRAPLSGIMRSADRLGAPYHALEVAVRTGDTPSEERARFLRRPADILITTPESLYLMLTSQARDTLRSVESVIVDEIHAIASTKRGTHLFLSLERLHALRPEGAALQRIGLSATQKPLEEVAQLLGGYAPAAHDAARTEAGTPPLAPRPVVIANAQAARKLELTIEVPVEDMSELRASEQPLSSRNEGDPPRSIWSSIHPRLVELVRAHRSTMVFVNNRRLAERLAAAINETAGEPLARAHHGSVAREERVTIEDALKGGQLPCIVATSSLELGLDIGAVELVVQIEAPPSVSSGIQRIGRANHQVGGNPRGSIFPKHRGDLVACAEAARRMQSAEIETTRYPRNALDVLAQQVVAIVASEESISVPELLRIVRGAAPYAELKREQLEGLLDMLSGRYPSDEFAELRPRLTWYREDDRLEPRKGSKQLAIANAGVIPDRGLYGVFLAGDNEKKSRRVGELDEEMVFEAREGEVFILGASSWRIEEITPDRVLVTPAPGMPGKMPFWRGDGLGRSMELGRGIGALLRQVARADDAAAERMLRDTCALDERAAKNLVRYVREQEETPYAAPSDQRLVIETFLDEVGDYRVCLLSPFGLRVHMPLALCMQEKAQRELNTSLEAVWTDDGIVFRFPERDEPPALSALFPSPEEVEELLLHALADTPLFASHFRECAARSLLLPRRSAQKRAPLWAQRKRSASLLSVVSRFPSFPIVLETYRECLQDVFDVPALNGLLGEVARHKLKLLEVRAEKPSPFAVSLLFNYVGNFIYDSDAPLAERKAAALSIDPAQLRELLGQAELKDLLDPLAIEEAAAQAARLHLAPRHPDELHDLLLLVGDLSEQELTQRLGEQRESLVNALLQARRALLLRMAGEPRLIAVEDSARYRDAVGVMPPAGLPSAFLTKVDDPLGDIVLRYARCHGPFSVTEVSARYSLPEASVRDVLDRAVARGRLLRGELHPQKAGITYCDLDVMRGIKRRSLAKLRSEMEAVEPLTYARFLQRLHGIGHVSYGAEALRSSLARLGGMPVDLSVLERDILPARVRGFAPSDLDQLLASGELVWRGLENTAQGAGRIALYFRDQFDLLAPPKTEAKGPLVQKIREVLAARGAVFFHDLVRLVTGFPPDVLSALWDLIWAGEVTNDTLQPLRSLNRGSDHERKRGVRVSRALPGSEGRFSLLHYEPVSEASRRLAWVQQLLLRHGVLAREVIKAEGIPGGFSSIYEVLKAMEESGKLRRGYFVEGLGAAQFVEPGVDERLRAERELREGPRAFILASTDPASPWGLSLAWPTHASAGQRPMRAVGANVIVANDGRALCWLARKEHSLISFLSPADPERSADAALVVGSLARPLTQGARRALLISAVDGADPQRSALGAALVSAGFQPTARGLLKRGLRAGDEAVGRWARATPQPAGGAAETSEESDDDEDG